MQKKKTESRSSRFISQWAGAAVCLLSLSASILTLPQDLVWGDSPELAASAWILGIPHPTGYPLYMLALRIFQALPAGTVIFRAHIFSAVCFALAAWVLWSFLRRMLETVFGERSWLTTWPAFAAALAWPLTPLAASQSRIAEVYALYALQFALGLWLLGYAMQNPQRAMPPLALLIGTMLVHHRLSVILIVLIGLFVILRLCRRTSPWFGVKTIESGNWSKTIRRSLICLLIPLLCLAYFPWRASQDPAINWYNPDNAARLYQLISGELYAGILTQNIQNLLEMDFYSVLTGFLHLLLLPFLCFSILILPLLWGFWILWKKANWLAVFTLLCLAAHQGFVFVYRVGDWPVFLLPSLITLTIPLAFGMAGVLSGFEMQGVKRSVIRLTAFFFVTASFLPLWVRFDGRGGLLENPFALSNYAPGNGALTERLSGIADRSAAAYASGVWRKIPNGAPLITGLTYETADNELHPLLYQQIVEERRPQTILVGAGFLRLDWYSEAISRRLSIPILPKRGQLFASRDSWLQSIWGELMEPLLARGPVYTTSFSLTNPPPRTWMEKADFRYLGLIPIDRRQISPFYDFYVPGGHVYQIEEKSDSSETKP
ncbi:MAG: protein O-mannosyl-transferase family [Candidatus Hinthialibacter sp.]